jgi:hypothetical protein
MSLEYLNALSVPGGHIYGVADARFRNRHINQTCIVIANGPSLKDVPLDFLKAYHSFGCNRIYLLEDFTPTYFVQIGADQVAGERASDFHEICGRVEASFVNRQAVMRGAFAGIQHVYGIHSRPLDDPNAEKGIGMQFSTHPLYAIGIGGSIIFQSFQLAYWMGFSTCLVVGLDHDYPKNWEVPWHFYPNEESVTSKEGPFGGRRSWAQRTERAFQVSREAFVADARQILNLTPGSKCYEFPTGDIQAWLPLESHG